MALPLSPGDVITLGTLLFKTYQKCKSASAEYQDLARVIQSTQYCVQSTQCSVNNIYHDLPEIHKVSLGTAIAGLRDVVTSISDDLDKVSTIRPDRGGPRARNYPNCDTITKSSMQNLVALNQIALCAKPAATPQEMKPSQATNSYNRLVGIKTSSEISAWTSAANSAGNILCRGYFDYAATVKTWEGPRIDRVEYVLRIQGTQILGSSRDSIGAANIEGSLDPTHNTVTFIKHYFALANRSTTRWEYVGCFTPCGIVGEWRFPSDPPARAHFRGKFGIWLQKDEVANGAALEDQIELLKTKGQILTRSLTMGSSGANGGSK